MLKILTLLETPRSRHPLLKNFSLDHFSLHIPKRNPRASSESLSGKTACSNRALLAAELPIIAAKVSASSPGSQVVGVLPGWPATVAPFVAVVSRLSASSAALLGAGHCRSPVSCRDTVAGGRTVSSRSCKDKEHRKRQSSSERATAYVHKD